MQTRHPIDGRRKRPRRSSQDRKIRNSPLTDDEEDVKSKTRINETKYPFHQEVIHSSFCDRKEWASRTETVESLETTDVKSTDERMESVLTVKDCQDKHLAINEQKIQAGTPVWSDARVSIPSFTTTSTTFPPFFFWDKGIAPVLGETYTITFLPGPLGLKVGPLVEGCGRRIGCRVLRVMNDGSSQALECGVIHAGDVVVSVDRVDVTAMEYQDILNLLKTPQDGVEKSKAVTFRCSLSPERMKQSGESSLLQSKTDPVTQASPQSTKASTANDDVISRENFSPSGVSRLRNERVQCRSTSSSSMELSSLFMKLVRYSIPAAEMVFSSASKLSDVISNKLGKLLTGHTAADFEREFRLKMELLAELSQAYHALESGNCTQTALNLDSIRAENQFRRDLNVTATQLDGDVYRTSVPSHRSKGAGGPEVLVERKLRISRPANFAMVPHENEASVQHSQKPGDVTHCTTLSVPDASLLEERRNTIEMSDKRDEVSFLRAKLQNLKTTLVTLNTSQKDLNAAYQILVEHLQLKVQSFGEQRSKLEAICETQRREIVSLESELQAQLDAAEGYQRKIATLEDRVSDITLENERDKENQEFLELQCLLLRNELKASRERFYALQNAEIRRRSGLEKTSWRTY